MREDPNLTFPLQLHYDPWKFFLWCHELLVKVTAPPPVPGGCMGTPPAHKHVHRGGPMHKGTRATMGQVCFTAISFNRTCHHSLHYSQFSVPAHVPCVRLSKCSMAGVRGYVPSSLLHCTRSAVACWECKHSARLTLLCLGDRRVGPYLYRPNSKDSRNPNFCVGCFELIISKILATASKMGKKYLFLHFFLRNPLLRKA